MILTKLNYLFLNQLGSLLTMINKIGLRICILKQLFTITVGVIGCQRTLFYKNTYSWLAWILEPAVSPKDMWTTFSNCSIINIYSMACLGLADPGSWILSSPDLGSRILDLESQIQKQQQKNGVKKIWCPTFFCSHQYHKNENYFTFELVKKKIWANLQGIIELSKI
jgi:hypothetical protein